MAQTIKLKRSATPGAIPSIASLELGEIAINTHDGKVYIKKDDGTSPNTIIEVSASSGGGFSLLDNEKAIFGTDSDLEIYHNGSNSIIDEKGTGSLKIQVASTDVADFTADGIIVTGDVEANEFIGDLRGAVEFHAQAGEALAKGDVVYISGISGNTTIVSKADADDASKMPAFGIAVAAASLNSSCEIVTFGSLGGLDTDTPAWPEGTELYVSTTAGILTNTAPTGEASLIQKIAKVTKRHISTGSIKVIGAGRSNATPNLNEGRLFVGNASNQSVPDGTIHVDIANSRVGIGTDLPATALDVVGIITTDGMTTSADINFGDNNKALFGAGDDLQIYHTGTNSILKSLTGELLFQGDGITLRGNSPTETMMTADVNGAVTLHHDSLARLATTATGIDVTGVARVDGNVTIGRTTGSYLFTEIDGGDERAGIHSSADNDLTFKVNNQVTAINIDGATRDISFYEDTGTTAKLTWDASAESLGIGTDTPDAALHVVSSTVAEFKVGNIGPSNNSAIRVSRNDTTVSNGNPLGYLEFGGNDSTSNLDTAFAYVGAEASGTHAAGNNPTELVFGTTAGSTSAPVERMRINAAGNATFTGDVTVSGDLFVTGTSTSVNVEDLNVEQGEITLNFGAGDTSAAANGAGIRIQDAVDASTDATILWNTTSDKFEFSHGIISAGPITGSNLSGTNTGDETQTSINALDITEVGTITSGVWNGTIIAEAYLQNQSGTNTGDETLASINALDITEVGTITSGTWQGTAIASAYLDADTAHLSGTQTFTGNKTFSGGLGVSDSSPSLVINDSDATNATNQVGYLSFQRQGVEKAWIGYGSSGNANFTIKNTEGAVTIDSNVDISASGTLTVGGSTNFGARYTETVVTLSSVSGATNVDISQAGIFDITLSGSATLTFTNPPTAGKAQTILLVVRQGGSGSYTCSVTNALYTDGVAPVLSTGVGDIDTLSYFTLDAGTSYFGAFAMANLS